MPKFTRIVVEAPATTANLGPGFDVFGLALERPRDRITIELTQDGGISISVSSKESIPIPTSPESNSAGRVALKALREFSIRAGLRIDVHKGVPIGIGLGSSGASAAAAALAVDRLFDLKLTKNDLIRLATEGEVAAAGFGHADNVSASILGSFTLVRSYEPIDVLNLPSPPNLKLAISTPMIPRMERKTEKLREILPKMVRLEDMVRNVGNASAIAVAFATSDISIIARAMEDSVVEPARAPLIPGYKAVREMAKKAGALGVAISGAGPSMISFVDSRAVDPGRVARAMEDGFRSAGVEAGSFTAEVGSGARVVEEA